MWRNDGHWHVEASRGALDRRCRRFAFDNELAALSKVDVICGSQGGDGWREVAI
jgi:hypothetical protein